ncbi:oxidoreductase [Furfurilactobacillus rossiae]|uniref:NADPH-dependent F420 reductase n=1 Tax=Furfurilactobacillus rossiae TaxID=231049 RepID=UPI0015B9E084|nr:NAD(P)-binding domain-containing protein [Furfurilactobacillus rossiae]MCF6166672.1 NAD(P)-binding domain-containing protein [Furfurilactobacillus rossiae]QLE63321.1 oxidoreductase [Furfurilactobacillus rossiae]
MSAITIFGKGNMGQALGKVFTDAGNDVNYIGSSDPVDTIGDIAILAVPFNAAVEIAKAQSEKLAGKIVVDITNPLNFDTWDELVVPADSSAAAHLAELLPDSKVVKAFNTNFAASLNTAEVAGKQKTTVLAASNDEDAKKALQSALEGSKLAFVDAGSLRRARELEGTGFLQMTLAANEQIGWDGGFAVLK